MLFLFFFLQIFLSISSHEILKYTIEEKSSINTLIVDLSNELNIKSNSFYSIYELLSINKNLFSINNQTGHLRTNSIIDREQMCLKQQCSCNSCEIILQLFIQIQEKIIYKIIEIKIKDRNDHSPIFENQSMIHIIHIKENVPLGYRIILPSANDPDEGLNSVQSYLLDGANSDDFDIDFSSLDIPYLIVRSSLDHQRRSSYSLTLIASDYGQQPKPLSTSIQLDIRILNINDSIPTFLQSVYSIDIREDTLIGTNLLKIEAINDNNDNIFYEFLTESPFIIDYLTGQIQLNKSLDYEKEKFYRLTVKAYENLIPTYAIIFIRVIDINDNPVSISIKVEGNTTLAEKGNDINVLFTPENTPIGTILAHVILNDLDSFANGNPYLQLRTNELPIPLIYKLIYQNSFQNLKYYSLILNKNLDRELKSIYNNIQLITYDSGTPRFYTKLNLILNVTDINDCIPKIIINSTIYHINENNPIGFIIDKLSAYDCDINENAEINYNLLNKTDLLIINSKTGEISLNQSIDFEQLNKFKQKNLTMIDLEFYIQVQDHGKPSLSSEIKIILRIHDLNDNSPIFNQNQSYNWSFSQSNLQSNSILGKISAYDNDSGLQGLIYYTIHSFNPCFILNITSLGYIYIPYKFSCSLSSYYFEIIANDYSITNSRLTKQILIINIYSNLRIINHSLPKLLPLTIEQTIIDINTIGNIAFIIDISTINNPIYQPKISLLNNNTNNLFSCWNINSNGEISLISKPLISSYILLLNISDEYTNKNSLIKFQINICNSSISNSCEKFYLINKQLIFIYKISFILIIIFLFICIFLLIIYLSYRKRKYHNNQLLTINKHLSSSSTSSSSSSSSNEIPINIDLRYNYSQYNQKEINNIQISKTSSTYYYDLKLAELLRQNQHPSLSTDYGFSSLELSTSSSTSTLPNHYIELNVDQSPQKHLNTNSFISSHECVV